LKEYHTTPSNKKYGIDNLPTDDMRLFDEEIKSAPEWERDSMTTDNSTKSSKRRPEEEEFDFENSRSTKDKSGASDVKEDHQAISSE